MMGPGKYDDLCTIVREKTRAQGAIVMVFHGDSGSDFSVQAPADVVARLPAILRHVAGQIESGEETIEGSR